MRVRESFFETFGGMDFDAPPALLGARLVRAFGAQPPEALGRAGVWAPAVRAPGRRRAGGAAHRRRAR